MKNVIRAGVAFGALAVFAAPLLASASTVTAERLVAIPKGEAVTGNVYAAGAQVVVSADAPADVVAAGGAVTVNGSVAGSVLAAGGTVNVLGDVAGSVRVIGGQIAISGTVQGDVLAAGGTVMLMPGSVVKGDVIMAAGTLDAEGAIMGSVRAAGNMITVNGAVEGPVTIEAGKSVAFGPHAAFSGPVSYRAPQEAQVAQGAVLGTNVHFAARAPMRSPFGKILVILGAIAILKMIALFVASFAAAYALPGFTRRLSTQFVSRFWRMLAVGFVALIVVPVAALVLLLTAIGSYLAFALGTLYLLAFAGTAVFLGVFSGALLSRFIRGEAKTDWSWILLGIVALAVLALIPILGWMVLLGILCATFGTIVMSMVHDAREKAAE